MFAFGGEKVEIQRYNKRLINAKNAVRRKGFWSGLGDGIMRFLFFGSMSLAFWYGVILVLDDRDKEDKEYTPAVLMIVMFFSLNSDAHLDLISLGKKLIVSIFSNSTPTDNVQFNFWCG